MHKLTSYRNANCAQRLAAISEGPGAVFHCALQPDINIPLHIVALEERQATVLDQIRRPVFSLLEIGPLSERCSLLTYDDVRDIAAKPDLAILDGYQDFAAAVSSQQTRRLVYKFISSKFYVRHPSRVCRA